MTVARGRRVPARASNKPRSGRPAGASAAATRRTILDAARALFSQWGYDATRVKDVALKAEVNAALVHHYFGDKDDLYQTVLVDALRPIRVLGQRLLVRGLPVDLLLAAWVEVLSTYFEKHQDILFLVTREAMGNPRRVRKLLVETLGPLFQGTLEALDGVRGGSGVDPGFLVVNILGMIAVWHTHTPLIDAVLERDCRTEAERLKQRQQIMALINHGVLGRPAARSAPVDGRAATR
ncbi:MAG: TetR/AcrR family transcriptional regulator [Deltaproteobacteria bacterium]|nr:TetR/AcrR family transcriptional regulator [Deltaproteobacteria bacterium]